MASTSNVASTSNLKNTVIKRAAPLRKASQTAFKYLLVGKNSCVISWPGKVPFAIWTIGFLLMLTLTIKDFSPLLDDYVNNNNATDLKIKTKPIYPNLTICLPTYSSKWREVFRKVCSLDDGYLNGSKSMRGVCDSCEAMRNHSFDFWNYLDKEDLHCDFYYASANVKWIAQKLVRDGPNNFAINHTNLEWLQPIMSSMLLYFSLMHWIDIGVALGSEEHDFTDALHNNFNNEELDELFDFLRRALAASLTGGCSVLSNDRNYTYHNIPDSTTRFPLHLASFSPMNEKFCFPMPHDFGDQDFVCSFSRWPLSWERFDQNVFEIHPSPIVLYSQRSSGEDEIVNPLLLSQKVLYSTDDELHQKKNVSEHVYVTYDVSTKLIINNPGCSKERYPDVCITKLQVQAAIDYCGCVPFSSRDFRRADQTIYPYCNALHYNSSCQRNLRISFNVNQDKCIQKCEFIYDSWPPTKTDIKEGKYDKEYPEFLVEFRASEKPFTEFSLVDKLTQEQFFASVGGLINLYIGGSGMTLFALLLLLIEQSKVWYRRKAKKTQPQNDSVDQWQFLRIVSIFRALGASDAQAKNDDATEAIENLKTQIEDSTKQTTEAIENLTKQIENLTKQNDNSTKRIQLLESKYYAINGRMKNISKEKVQNIIAQKQEVLPSTTV